MAPKVLREVVERDETLQVQVSWRNNVNLGKYIPIFKRLSNYSRIKAISDFIAGVTLGLTIIPQSIAYATLAGLPAQYGLYSSFAGGFLYAIFGSVKEISIGPTSLMAILTLQYTKGMPVDFVVLLTFLSGCIQLVMGLLDLGFLVDFISLPVTSGFTSATSVMIIITQLQGLTGLKYRSSNLLEQFYKFFKNVKSVRLGDSVLGLSSLVILLCLKALKDVKLSSGKRRNTVIKKIFWFVSVGRNALVVLTCSVIAYYFKERLDQTPFVFSKKVEQGLPNISLPRFSASSGNETYSFFEICSHLSSGIVVLPVVSVFANVAIAKVFASGSSIDASQEMRALGLCNLFGSCVNSMPTCGAFTRSAVSHASGVETPVAGVYSGLLSLLALSFLTPYFQFIPRSALSAVLISAVIFLIDWQIVRKLWIGSKRDAAISIGTFVVCLALNVEAGLLFGIISNVIYLLYISARPEIDVTECKTSSGHRYLVIQPDIGLFYPAVDFLANKIFEISEGMADKKIPLVVDCQRFRGMDYTAVKGMEKLANDFKSKGQSLWFLNVSGTVVKSVQKLGDFDSFVILEKEQDVVTLLCSNGKDSRPPESKIDVVADENDPAVKAVNPEEESLVIKVKIDV